MQDQIKNFRVGCGGQATPLLGTQRKGHKKLVLSLRIPVLARLAEIVKLLINPVY